MADKIIVKELVTKLSFKADRSGITGADSMLDGFRKRATMGLTKIVDIGAKAILGVGAVMTAITAGSIASASSLESVNAQFEVMLGSAEKANKLVVDLQQMGSKTPFQTKDLAKGAQTLLAFGLAAEEILPTLQNLGDIAGNDNNRLKQLTLAFAQMQSAGRLMGQDLLQMVNAGFNPLQVISEKTGKSMLELKKQMEKGAISADMVKDAFRSATAEGGRFYQNMIKQSKTFKGVFSTLRDNIALVGQVWGKNFLGGIKAVASALIRLFQGPVMEGVKLLSEKLLPDIDNLGDSVAAWIDKAGPKVIGFFQLIADGIDWFKDLSAKTKNYIEAIEPLLNVVGAILSKMTDLFLGLFTAQIKTSQGFDTFILKAILGLNWIIEAGQALYTQFTTWFSALWKWLSDGFVSLKDSIMSSLSGVFEWLGKVWEHIAQSFSDLFSTGFANIKVYFGEFLDFVWMWGSKFVEIFFGVFTLIGDAFGMFFSAGEGAFTKLLEVVSKLPIIKTFLGPFQKAFEWIGEKVRALTGWLTSIPGIDIKLPDFPDLTAIINKPREDIAKNVEKNAKIQNNKINQIFNTKVDGAGSDGDSLAGLVASKTGDMVKAAFSVQLQEVLTVTRGV